ncbi:unnamed protein product [Ciceribacter selenitireducens ATCC BAA-1503]|uniref:Uncharacterized protein n=1 Tax=Ciceribacter selenitireducens ATCC BAA-1503 TaxID=1336235 RepID=A0A376ACQ9_9HYPH|nr:unnamed protein product [Ciceribacter selenitireducens ATCC BAA-1503]
MGLRPILRRHENPHRPDEHSRQTEYCHQCIDLAADFHGLAPQTEGSLI